MKVKGIMTIGTMAAFLGTLGVGLALGAEQNQPSAFGRAGNQGEGFTEEHAVPGKGQVPESSLGQDVQVTLGGARPVVEGQILNVQGEDFIIKDAGGSAMRVRVNKDTSMDCGTGKDVAMSTGRQADDQREIPPTAHMQEQSGQGQSEGQSGQASASGERIGDQSGTQSRSTLGKDSGGDIVRGSGFVIGPKGDCHFKAGDKIRAQVSDLGTVLYIKSISDQDTRAQQARSGQMIPQQSGPTPGEQASAQQRAQMLKPGSVPAPPDLQNAEHITGGQQPAKADTRPQNLCEGCHVLRGQILQSDQKSLLVKDASQKEVRLKVDEHTKMGQLSHPIAGTFVEGDRIEAYVTPDGRAWSITALKQQQSQPGVVGAPGD